MKAFTFKSLIMMVPALALAASPARAQDAPASAPQAKSPAVQVTPFLALGTTGSSPVGTAISLPVSSNFSIEPEVGFRRGEGRINALSSNASLLFALPHVGRTIPYLAAGAGLGQYGTPIVGTDGSVIGTEARVGFFVNAGGGLKVPVDDSWGTRAGSSHSATTRRSAGASLTAFLSTWESGDRFIRPPARSARDLSLSSETHVMSP